MRRCCAALVRLAPSFSPRILAPPLQKSNSLLSSIFTAKAQLAATRSGFIARFNVAQSLSHGCSLMLVVMHWEVRMTSVTKPSASHLHLKIKCTGGKILQPCAERRADRTPAATAGGRRGSGTQTDQAGGNGVAARCTALVLLLAHFILKFELSRAFYRLVHAIMQKFS